MNRDEKIVIASTSDTIIDYVINNLEKIGAVSKIYRAHDQVNLNHHLNVYSPQFLLIENCFWHSATPLELTNLINKYSCLKVYVFEVAEYMDNLIRRTLRVGIDGYLSIRKGQTRFRNELKLALRGKLVVPPEIGDGSYDYIAEIDENLTERDLELITLICQEMDNKEIGKTLKIKVQSVKNRRSKMYAKVNVKNCIGLVKYLFRKKMLDVNDFMAL